MKRLLLAGLLVMAAACARNKSSEEAGTRVGDTTRMRDTTRIHDTTITAQDTTNPNDTLPHIRDSVPRNPGADTTRH